MQNLGIESISEYALENFRYFLDRDLYALRTKEELKTILLEALESESGKLIISMALDQELNRRAKEIYGDE